MFAQVDPELQAIVDRINSSNSITVDQGKALRGYKGIVPPFVNLPSLTKEDAQILSKVRYLNLHRVTSLTDETADILTRSGKKNVLILPALTVISDEQASAIGRTKELLHVYRLESITNLQMESLSNVESLALGVKQITNEQAKSLSKVRYLSLLRLEEINDEQAESLGKVRGLSLGRVTSITDQQAESLSKVKEGLSLRGLTTLSEEQARSLSKVENLGIQKALQSLIDKYKQQ